MNHIPSIVLCFFALLAAVSASSGPVGLYDFSSYPNPLIIGNVTLVDDTPDNLNFTGTFELGSYITVEFQLTLTSLDGSEVFYQEGGKYFSSSNSISMAGGKKWSISSCYVPALYNVNQTRIFRVVVDAKNATCNQGKACDLTSINAFDATAEVSSSYVGLDEDFMTNYVQSTLEQDSNVTIHIDFDDENWNGAVKFAFGDSCFGSTDLFTVETIPDQSMTFSKTYTNVPKGNIYFEIQTSSTSWKAHISVPGSSASSSSESDWDKHKGLYIALIVIGCVAALGGVIGAVLFLRKRNNYQAMH